MFSNRLCIYIVFTARVVNGLSCRFECGIVRRFKEDRPALEERRADGGTKPGRVGGASSASECGQSEVGRIPAPACGPVGCRCCRRWGDARVQSKGLTMSCAPGPLVGARTHYL